MLMLQTENVNKYKRKRKIMAKLNFDQLGKNIEGLLKVMTLASKMGILVGGICISAYSLKIGHFPQGLTIGDGLLFMLAAACFGIIYIFFVGSLVSLGVTVSPLIKYFSQIYLWTYKFRNTRKPSQIYDFAKFKWSYLIFAFFAVLFVLGLGSNDHNAYWNLPLLSIAMFFFYSAYLSTGEKIKNLEISLKSVVQIDEKDSSATGKIENLRKAQMLSLGVLMVMPLFVSGVTGQLLDGAMRQAHLRIENAIVFVKEPYATLIPVTAKSPAQPMPAQYVKFEKITVLFKGLGTTTVLSFVEGKVEKRLEIPNDQLIVN